MDRLCNEVIQLIFFELGDPSALALTSKRLYQFSQDPYVRALYFLTRYGHISAMFWALGRGKLMTERVLDILLTSGAQLSRYLVQIAMHHYFRTSAHFVKSQWVRSVPFPVFTYFLKLASDMYGDIPVGKGDDDGSLFATFLKESRFSADMKTVKWEEIKEIMERYKFIPFANKDPIMAQFPLALAVEPQLLPLAVANGFEMDTKYRDFVFRKMFERPAVSSGSGDGRCDEIVRNVRELCRLDSSMFLSRTVSAEVCMEARTNEIAYAALKKLDKSGDLLFEMSSLVEDLIKLFVKARSLTASSTALTLRLLYSDFRSDDPTVRLVMLLTVFLSDTCSANTTPSSIRNKLDALGLTPLSRKDIFNVLINPFVERHAPILQFAEMEVGLDQREIKALAEEVAIRCLEVECKGKTLQRLLIGFPHLGDVIAEAVVPKYRIDLDDLPSHEDEKACMAYEAKLCRDYSVRKFADIDEEGESSNVTVEDEANTQEGAEGAENDVGEGDQDQDNGVEDSDDDDESDDDDGPELGRIGQDTLSTMIRQDESTPRARRRHLYYMHYVDGSSKFGYPVDALPVGSWIRSQYGVRSHVTAVFMTHAILNENNTIVPKYTGYNTMSHHVPVTLKHFKLLARLGRAPSWYLWHDIEMGAEFFFSEDDYLSKHKGFGKIKVKTEVNAEVPQSNIWTQSTTAASGSKVETSPRGKKRPRRTATAIVKSYVDPDSDDEAIAEEGHPWLERQQSKRKRVESNLQRWIKHLSLLLKEEQKKYKEKKKNLEKSAPPDAKIRVPKTEFLKALVPKLRDLRKQDQEKRVQLYGLDVADADYSDGDDEYHFRNNRASKRRRTTQAL